MWDLFQLYNRLKENGYTFKESNSVKFDLLSSAPFQKELDMQESK